MPRKRDDILTSLARKGFERSESGDHHQLVYDRLAGGRTARRTKISRGSSHRDVSDTVPGLMARQLGVTKAQLTGLIDCPPSREDCQQAAGLNDG